MRRTAPKRTELKSIHRFEYDALLECLVEARRQAGLTQAELAQRMKRTQSFVSGAELGERRLDLLQCDDLARACGLTLPELALRVDKALTAARKAAQDGGPQRRAARTKRQPKMTRGRGRDAAPRKRAPPKK